MSVGVFDTVLSDRIRCQYRETKGVYRMVASSGVKGASR